MEAAPSLSIKNRDSGELSTYKVELEAISFGRDRGNSIVLPSKRISRKHSEIRRIDNNYFIVDLESGNGTYLNQQRLAPNEKMLLKNRDKVRIENYEIVFVTSSTQKPDFGDVTDTDILEMKMLKKLLRAVDKENGPVLEVISGPAAGKQFVFAEKVQEVVIGRDPSCEFHIDVEVISRKHAHISKKWDTLTLIDLGSKNGIHVNDEKVSQHVLADGDRILLGTLPLLYKNPTDHNFDFIAANPPPEAPEQEVVAPATDADAEPAPAPSEEAPEAPQELSGQDAFGTDVGGRVARRSDKAGTEASEVSEISQASREDDAEPEENPYQEEFPPAQEESYPTANPEPEDNIQVSAETNLPFWARLSVFEILGAMLGLGILSGSVWLLLKMF